MQNFSKILLKKKQERIFAPKLGFLGLFLPTKSHQTTTMNNIKLEKVGKVVQTKGLSGEIKIACENFFLDYLSVNPLPHIYISEGKNTLPYFVQQQSQLDSKQNLTIKLEDVDTKEQAERLRACDLFFDKDKLDTFFHSLDIEEYTEQTWDFLIGYTLIDTDDKTIGIVTDVFYLNQHQLAAVDYAGKEVLIPLHEDIVELLDEDAKIIVMDLPDGLLDL